MLAFLLVALGLAMGCQSDAEKQISSAILLYESGNLSDAIESIQPEELAKDRTSADVQRARSLQASWRIELAQRARVQDLNPAIAVLDLIPDDMPEKEQARAMTLKWLLEDARAAADAGDWSRARILAMRYRIRPGASVEVAEEILERVGPAVDVEDAVRAGQEMLVKEDSCEAVSDIYDVWTKFLRLSPQSPNYIEAFRLIPSLEECRQKALTATIERMEASYKEQRREAVLKFPRTYKCPEIDLAGSDEDIFLLRCRSFTWNDAAALGRTIESQRKDSNISRDGTKVHSLESLKFRGISVRGGGSTFPLVTFSREPSVAEDIETLFIRFGLGSRLQVPLPGEGDVMNPTLLLMETVCGGSEGNAIETGCTACPSYTEEGRATELKQAQAKPPEEMSREELFEAIRTMKHDRRTRPEAFKVVRSVGVHLSSPQATDRVITFEGCEDGSGTSSVVVRRVNDDEWNRAAYIESVDVKRCKLHDAEESGLETLVCRTSKGSVTIDRQTLDEASEQSEHAKIRGEEP